MLNTHTHSHNTYTYVYKDQPQNNDTGASAVPRVQSFFSAPLASETRTLWSREWVPWAGCRGRNRLRTVQCLVGRRNFFCLFSNDPSFSLQSQHQSWVPIYTCKFVCVCLSHSFLFPQPIPDAYESPNAHSDVPFGCCPLTVQQTCLTLQVWTHCLFWNRASLALSWPWIMGCQIRDPECKACKQGLKISPVNECAFHTVHVALGLLGTARTGTLERSLSSDCRSFPPGNNVLPKGSGGGLGLLQQRKGCPLLSNLRTLHFPSWPLHFLQGGPVSLQVRKPIFFVDTALLFLYHFFPSFFLLDMQIWKQKKFSDLS